MMIVLWFIWYVPALDGVRRALGGSVPALWLRTRMGPSAEAHDESSALARISLLVHDNIVVRGPLAGGVSSSEKTTAKRARSL